MEELEKNDAPENVKFEARDSPTLSQAIPIKPEPGSNKEESPSSLALHLLPPTATTFTVSIPQNFFGQAEKLSRKYSADSDECGSNDEDSDGSYHQPSDIDDDNDGEEDTTPEDTIPKRHIISKTTREYFDKILATGSSNGDAAGIKRKADILLDSTAKRKKNDSESMTSLLINANSTIVSHQAGAQHKVFATRKEDYMREMKRLIPVESDTRRALQQLKDLQEASKIFGHSKVHADNGCWRYSRINCCLTSPQLVGTSWMVRRELIPGTPLGGILGDSMGMGKTVMALSLIAANAAAECPDLTSKTRKATLVVVPNKTMADQWESEVRKFCCPNVADWTTQYIPPGKGSTLSARFLILIATYSDVRREYPKPESMNKLRETYKEGSAEYIQSFRRSAGILFKKPFYRIVLDEAHAIKSSHSATTIAVLGLQAKYRWALSGTPLVNATTELIPYLQFLGIDNVKDGPSFKRTYIGPDGRGNSALDVLMSTIMLRRTQLDQFGGHAILELQGTTRDDVWVDMSVEDRIFVEAIKDHYSQYGDNEKVNIDEILDEIDADCDKKLGRNHGVGDVDFVCLRPRQMVSHVFNLNNFLLEDIDDDEFEAIIRRLRSNTTQCIIDHLFVQKDMELYKSGLEILRKYNVPSLGGFVAWPELLTAIKGERHLRTTSCCNCKKATALGKITMSQCDHVYCQACFTSLTLQKQTIRKCVQRGCNGVFTKKDSIPSLAYKETPTEKRARNPEAPDRDYNNVTLRKQREKDVLFLGSTLGHIPLPPGTKTVAAIAIIQTWLREAPEDKIIVFCQFITTAEVLGWMLREMSVSFLYYFGSPSMGADQKREAIAKFKTESTIKVLVTSLRSGGQGLNLTQANRVIIIDAWWNATGENQAFGRVRRMGQEKHTYLVRLMSNETVDNKLESMQRTKSAQINHVLQDDATTSEATRNSTDDMHI